MSPSQELISPSILATHTLHKSQHLIQTPKSPLHTYSIEIRHRLISTSNLNRIICRILDIAIILRTLDLDPLGIFELFGSSENIIFLDEFVLFPLVEAFVFYDVLVGTGFAF